MRKAIIVGAGPAGLTAAYELLTRTDIIPVIVEKDSQVGGLAKTIPYKGNRIDIGGHRFFSKSEKIINWWLHFLPIDDTFAAQNIHLNYQHKRADLTVSQVGSGPQTMLVRPRKSRIYHQHQFFDYPLQLSLSTVRKLGFFNMLRIVFSYTKAKMFPEKPEANLAQFFRNRFGKKLYEAFFKDYTEKVWGIPCEKIPATWGSQRVKDLDISRLVKHALRTLLHKKNRSVNQEGTETSLIEQFLYPKYGPGQMWETVARSIIELGGELHLNTCLQSLGVNSQNIAGTATLIDTVTAEETTLEADYFFSTMPVKELMQKMTGIPIPPDVQRIAGALQYRDFLIVGILVRSLSVKDDQHASGSITDNWIYIQDNQVKAGRIQIFNNWSPFMVQDADTVWLGVEYFCDETDAFWQQPDAAIIESAIKEMQHIGMLQADQVLDAVVVKVEKAYPSYFGSYSEFDTVKSFLMTIENLYPVGRNGMHRYNNSDHSMLTAMAAVDHIISVGTSKERIWEINTDDAYHEKKAAG